MKETSRWRLSGHTPATCATRLSRADLQHQRTFLRGKDGKLCSWICRRRHRACPRVVSRFANRGASCRYAQARAATKSTISSPAARLRRASSPRRPRRWRVAHEDFLSSTCSKTSAPITYGAGLTLARRRMAGCRGSAPSSSLRGRGQSNDYFLTVTAYLTPTPVRADQQGADCAHRIRPSRSRA